MMLSIGLAALAALNFANPGVAATAAIAAADASSPFWASTPRIRVVSCRASPLLTVAALAWSARCVSRRPTASRSDAWPPFW